METVYAYAERIAETGIEPSVGSVDDSDGNALADTISGLYKMEVTQGEDPGAASKPSDMPLGKIG